MWLSTYSETFSRLPFTLSQIVSPAAALRHLCGWSVAWAITAAQIIVVVEWHCIRVEWCVRSLLFLLLLMTLWSCLTRHIYNIKKNNSKTFHGKLVKYLHFYSVKIIHTLAHLQCIPRYALHGMQAWKKIVNMYSVWSLNNNRQACKTKQNGVAQCPRLSQTQHNWMTEK